MTNKDYMYNMTNAQTLEVIVNSLGEQLTDVTIHLSYKSLHTFTDAANCLVIYDPVEKVTHMRITPMGQIEYLSDWAKQLRSK
jgi:hypothetical protein